MNKVIYLLIILLVASCDINTNKKTKILVTTSIIKDAVENIVGQKAEIVCLMGPGIDPHLYKATEQNLKDIYSADIIVYSGLHLEGKIDEILKSIKEKKVICITDNLNRDSLIKVDNNTFDPHIWFDINLWSNSILHLSKEISSFDTINSEFYIQNTDKYLDSLKMLDSQISKYIQKVNPRQRILITAHDAFSYFGRRYGFEVKGIQGISTITEAGIKDMLDLSNIIVSNNIRAIFVETSVSSKNIEALIQNVKSKGININNGGYLYSDALGDKASNHDTYISMYRHNIITITTALSND